MRARSYTKVTIYADFIDDYLRESLAITELYDLYGISRKSGYKWIDRYLQEGPTGLDERSRKPRRSPNQTPEHLVATILRARHPGWGGKKAAPVDEIDVARLVLNPLDRQAWLVSILKREVVRSSHSGARSSRRYRSFSPRHPPLPGMSQLC